MPRLQAHQKALIKSLVQKHASNAIIRRQVNRAVGAGKKYINQQAKSGAITRGFAGLGNRVYGNTGRLVGEALGRGITGHGDYHIGSNKHLARHDSGHMGYRHTKGGLEKGEMFIEHSDFVGTLISGNQATSLFTSQSYAINAGNQLLFPFLSSIAQNFQQYEFTKLLVEFRSTTSESAGNSVVLPMGKILASCQYDSALNVFVNDVQMENSDFSISAKPSENMKMCVETKSNYNVLGRYYVSGNQALANSGITNSDLRMNNLGILQIASVGIPTGSSALSLGEIWVHYACKLYKPTIQGQFYNINSSHYVQNVASTTAGGWFETMVPATNNYMTLTFPDTYHFAFPSGMNEGSYYFMYIGYVAAGTTFTTQTSAPQFTAVNGSIINIWTNLATGSGPGSTNPACACAPFLMSAAATCESVIFAGVVNITGPNCVIDWGTNTQNANFTNSNLIVTPWNANMTA